MEEEYDETQLDNEEIEGKKENMGGGGVDFSSLRERERAGDLREGFREEE